MLDYQNERIDKYVEDWKKGEGFQNFKKEEDLKAFLGKAASSIHWGLTLIQVLWNAYLDAFVIPNPHDITIYSKINSSFDYSTIIEGFEGELSIEDIIDQVQQN